MPYVDRVNRAIDVIVTQLDQPLRLEEISRAAGFSPCHFHRIFSALMGETLGQFVKRVRLERALSLMSRTPKRPLTDIALACGFASSSDFSRSFKQRYGLPPSRFDLKAWRESRREGMEATVREAAKENMLGDGVQFPRLPAGENPDGFEVELRDLPVRTVAYIRVLDPYRGTGVVEAVHRLIAWAEARGLADRQWLGYMWDDPEIVAVEDTRYDVAVDITGTGVQPDGEVGVFQFPAMRVAQVPVRGSIELEVRAFDWLYGTWLPKSGHVPGDQPSFEAWVGRPFGTGYDYFEIDVQLPVVVAGPRSAQRQGG
jgi:AraC family transcriptional regulator